VEDLSEEVGKPQRCIDTVALELSLAIEDGIKLFFAGTLTKLAQFLSR
jgi:hypothetical protein